MVEELELSVVMPCLNEAETLEVCIQTAWRAIRESGIHGEIIVSDNGSSDGSPAIAEKAGARVVHASAKGYGNALQAGIQAARGRYVVMGDADGSYDFGAIPPFLESLREGNDLVMGCRFPRYGGRIERGAMPWKHRWVGNPVLTGLGKFFFSSPVNDFHCGLRAFRRDAVVSLNLRTGGMEYASEMVMKATLAGLRISQIPITLRPDGRSRPPHLRSWRDGWRHLRFMLLFSPDWLFIFPGLIMALTGLIGFVILWPKPLAISSITFDLNSLLVSSTSFLVGFQIFLFGLFIKAYAVGKGLLPGKNYWTSLVKGNATEWGFLIGCFIALIGAGILGNAVLEWRAAGFGQLSYQESLRTVILAVTGIGLGIQIAFYGFALNILGLE
jgi:glycosyltransferase involved in cell wall biosynthesis